MRRRDQLTKAQSLFEHGEYEKAWEVLQPAVAEKQRGRSHSLQLEILDLAACALSQLGRNREAAEIRRQRVALLERLGEDTTAERIALAKVLAALGKLVEAEQVLGDPPPPGSDRTVGALHAATKAALHLRRTRDYEGASQLLESACRLLPPDAPAHRKAQVLVLRGHALRLAGKIPKAQAILQEAQKILTAELGRDGKAVVEFARCEFFLGDVYRVMGQLKLAGESYTKAKTILGRRASVHFTKRYWLRMGAVYFALGEFARASEAYLHPECIAAIERLGNTQDYVWSYLGACKALCAKGRLKEAHSYLERAKKVAGEQAGAFIQGHLALADGSLKEARELFDAALQAYKEAERGFRSIGESGNIPGIVDALVSQGLLALRTGEINKAIEVARVCAAEASRCGFLAVHGQELLLKSALLADGDVVSEELFRQVFEKLDTVLSPTVLFKVVANLYHYARHLHDYDLDVALETRLRKLRAVLDREVYERLMSTYVDRRFAQLIFEHLTKKQPGTATA